MICQIIPLTQEHKEQVLALSLKAWAPVFEKLQSAVQPYVYNAFYPDGWCIRQAADIAAFLQTEGQLAWIAVDEGSILGWVGAKLHPEDRMGDTQRLKV